MTTSGGFFTQAIVIDQIESLWAKVFGDSNKLLSQHLKFGYDGVRLLKDPTVNERVITLQWFSQVIDVLINSNRAGVDLGYEQTRQLLNAKSQITTMEQLVAALIAENQEDYATAVAALDKQTVV